MMVVLVRESALAPWDAAPPLLCCWLFLLLMMMGFSIWLFFEHSLALSLFGFVCEVYFWTLLMVANEQWN